MKFIFSNLFDKFFLSVFVASLCFPLLSLANSGEFISRDEFSDDIEIKCEHRASRRGNIDYGMYQWCVEGEEKSLSDIEDYNNRYDEPFYTDFAYPYCYKKHTRRNITDVGLFAFCLDNEIEGYLDITYYMEEGDLEKTISLAKEAMERYGSWMMAGHAVRNYFNPKP